MLLNKLILLCSIILFSTSASCQSETDGTSGLPMTIEDALRSGAEYLYAEGIGNPPVADKRTMSAEEQKLYVEALSKGQKRLFYSNNTSQLKRSTINAAKTVATGNLVKKINKILVKVSEETEFGAQTKNIVKIEVEGTYRGIEVVNRYTSYQETETGAEAVAIARIPIYGNKGIMRQLRHYVPAGAGGERFVPQDASPTSKANAEFDGLIVKIGKFPNGFDPKIHERIFTEKNKIVKVVYEPQDVPQDVMIARGMVKYTDTLTKAKAIMEVLKGVNPLVIDAIKLTKEDGYPVVSVEDAIKISQAEAATQLLARARVIFVIENE